MSKTKFQETSLTPCIYELWQFVSSIYVEGAHTNICYDTHRRKVLSATFFLLILISFFQEKFSN